MSTLTLPSIITVNVDADVDVDVDADVDVDVDVAVMYNFNSFLRKLFSPSWPEFQVFAENVDRQGKKASPRTEASRPIGEPDSVDR